jgi:hypothetical protein
MSQYDKWVLIALIVLYFPTVGLFCFMIFRVNRKLPASRRIRFWLLSWGDWTSLRANWTKLPTEYKRLYPRSILYRLAVSGAITLLVIAVAMFVLRFWEYTRHIP